MVMHLTTIKNLEERNITIHKSDNFRCVVHVQEQIWSRGLELFTLRQYK